MMKTSYCIGIMSGTSLDGVDLVYVRFGGTEKYDYKIIHSNTYSYSKQWILLLKSAFEKQPSELKELDKNYGVYIGNLVNDFILENKIKQVDLIASHGHTVFHKPEEGYTLQIGSGTEIAKITNSKVVFDFRTQDVNLGGQGAPLVPIGDVLLFAEFDYCLNLGGFANISFDEKDLRKAYDICPVNIVMNFYMNKIDQEFDDRGKLAKTGKIDKTLLKKLNSDFYYQLTHPKSLGFEFVKKNVIPLIDSYELELKDILRTFLEHVAFQVAQVISKEGKVLVTGGGAYNDFLIERIDQLTSVELVIPTAELLEFKEALIFALLGFLKVEGSNNCLKSVTGATKDHSTGVVIEA
ncbi:anhydro-N-acetylmuramic acid kinase [Flavicella sp.]|uniref:anhydro-N-acetylmuramic acid kinase n=1 Tax=Flavicella sp. TaxID=2957742 RepID=UPI003019CC21